jgi:hypothetical protein
VSTWEAFVTFLDYTLLSMAYNTSSDVIINLKRLMQLALDSMKLFNIMQMNTTRACNFGT